MRRFTFVTGLVAATLTAATSAAAQSYSHGPWGGYFAFGIPVPVGSADDFLGSKTSWNAGAVYSPTTANWGIRLDVAYSRFAIDDQTVIDVFGGSGGYARAWDLGLALEYGTSKNKPARFYVIGGASYSNVYAAVTEPTVVGGCYWDPWFGYICGTAPADEIIADRDRWAFGANGGVGISYQIHRGPALFVEGRYRIVFSKDSDNRPAGAPDPINTTYVPIVFGIRW